MNVLLFINSLHSGGAEKQLVLLANALSERKHRVYVAVISKGGELDSALKIGSNLSMHAFSRGSKFDISLIWRLREFIIRNKIDVVHGWMAPCNSVVGLASLGLVVQRVLSIRSSNMKYSFGRRVYQYLDGFIARLSKAKIICNSKAGKDYYEKNFYYPPCKTSVIANAIEQSYFVAPNLPALNPKVLQLGIVSRITPEKRHDLLIKAVGSLVNLGIPLKLHIIGGGPEQSVLALRKQVANLGVEEHVVWHGWVQDIKPLLADIHVLVSSSETEGFSNVLLEAIASKRIVIATNVGDSKEIINAETGYLIEPGDSAPIEAAIKYVVEDWSSALLKSRAGYELAKTYSISSMVGKHLQIYTRGETVCVE